MLAVTTGWGVGSGDKREQRWGILSSGQMRALVMGTLADSSETPALPLQCPVLRCQSSSHTAQVLNLGLAACLAFRMPLSVADARDSVSASLTAMCTGFVYCAIDVRAFFFSFWLLRWFKSNYFSIDFSDDALLCYFSKSVTDCKYFRNIGIVTLTKPLLHLSITACSFQTEAYH